MPNPLQFSSFCSASNGGCLRYYCPTIRHYYSTKRLHLAQTPHSNSKTKCIFTTQHAVCTLRILGAQRAGRACKVQRVALVVPCGPIVTYVVLHIQWPSTKPSATTAHESTLGPHHLSVMGGHLSGSSKSV